MWEPESEERCFSQPNVFTNLRKIEGASATVKQGESVHEAKPFEAIEAAALINLLTGSKSPANSLAISPGLASRGAECR